MKSLRVLFVFFILFPFVAYAQQTTILIHNIPTNASTPLTAGSCLIVDQNLGGGAYLDTKVCTNWAATFGALSIANNLSDLPNPNQAWANLGGNDLGRLPVPAQSALLGSSGLGFTNIALGSNLSLTNNVLSASGGPGGSPGGNPGQIQYNNGGTSFGGFDASGDFTINTSTGVGTLATVNSNIGTFSAVLINAKGLVTAGSTLSGDCTSSGALITCTKTNSALFAASATTDTTNASNITSGTLPAGRLPNSGVIAGSYTFSNITVDSTGRITSASNGVSSGVTWPANGTIVISNTTNTPGGITPSGDWTINTTTGVATLASVNSNIGTFASVTINAKGLVTAGAALSGDCTTSSGVITCTKTSGAAFAPSATTDTTIASNITSGILPAARLPSTAVTPGSYTNVNATVDATGRITAMSNGATAGVTWPANGTIIISNTTNSPAGITPSGDWTINTTTGVDTLASVNSNIGTFAAITINAKGLATAGTTLSGDCTTSSGVITCTKTNGTAFATSATTDTTNASNITSGTLPAGRLPTSGVVAGSYTLTNLTVDATGRITAASNGVATGAVFMGNTTGSANAYTISATTPSGFSLTDNFIVCGEISATNTAASTLTVSPAAAKSINVQTNGGLSALSGGELKTGGQKYCFQYSSTAGVWIVQTLLGPSVNNNQVSVTVNQSQWATQKLFVITAASQTLTLPTSSSLSAQGSIVINAVVAFTLAPTAASGNTIQTPVGTGAANASVIINAGVVATVTTDGAGHFYVNNNGTAAQQNVGTSGATLGLLNANKTDSGANTWLGPNVEPTCPLTDAATVVSSATGCVNDATKGVGTNSVTLTATRVLGFPTGLPANGGQDMLFKITHSGADGPILASGFFVSGGTPPECGVTTTGCWSTVAGAEDWLPCKSISATQLGCSPPLTNVLPAYNLNAHNPGADCSPTVSTCNSTSITVVVGDFLGVATGFCDSISSNCGGAALGRTVSSVVKASGTATIGTCTALTNAAGGPDATFNVKTDVRLCPVTVGGTIVVTSTLSGTALHMQVSVFDITGLAVSPDDGQGAHAVGTASAMSITTGTLSQSHEFVLGFFVSFSATSMSPGTGFTVIDNVAGTSGFTLLLEYIISGAVSTTQIVSGTQVATDWAGSAAGLKHP